MPQVWAPNHGAVKDAKGAHQEVCGAPILKDAATLKGQGSHFIRFHPFCVLKAFSGAGFKIRGEIFLSNSFYW